MATITANTGSNNWNTNGAWVGSVQPTAADDVIIPSGATVTIPASVTALCRSCTNQSGGTLVFAATTSVLTIGTSTPGTGNVAFSNAGTITLTAIGKVNFVSTSATQQTILTSGATMPNVTFNGAGGSWKQSDALTATGATITLTAGTWATGDFSVTAASFVSNGTSARTLAPGASAFTLSLGTGAFNIGVTGLTISANTAVFVMPSTAGGTACTLGGANLNGGSVVMTYGMTFNPGGGTVANLVALGLSGTRAGAFSLAGNVTVTGTLALEGNASTIRLLVQSSTLGTQRTITDTGASWTASVTLAGTTYQTQNVDISDIKSTTGTIDLSAISGGSGDALGNSGITFTTSQTQYAFSTINRNWSDSGLWFLATNGGGGAGRVPLPQDDVFFDGNTGNHTYTTDMPRLGRNIDISAFASGTITNTGGANPLTLYGNFSCLTNRAYGTGNTLTLSGRGSQTYTSNGSTIAQQINITAPGGVYTFADTFTSSRTDIGIILTIGTMAQGADVTTPGFTATGAVTRALQQNGFNINLNSLLAENIWNVASSGFTYTWSAGAAINITTAATTTRTFIGAGLNYPDLKYAVANSPGVLAITGANTFNSLTVGVGRVLTLPSSTTNTITNNFSAVGQNYGYVSFPSVSGNYSSAPDIAAYQLTGNMAMAVRITQPTATGGYLLSRSAVAPNRGYAFQYAQASDKLQMVWSADGTTVLTTTSTVTVTSAVSNWATVPTWVGCTWLANDGAGNNVTKYYTSSDGVSWTQLGATVTTAGASSNLAGTVPSLFIFGTPGIGSYPQVNGYAARLFNTNDLTVTPIFNADFTAKAFGSNTFTESSSNAATVTINGTLAQAGDGRALINSSTGGTQSTLTSSVQQSIDYATIQDSKVDVSPKWYAGAHSVSVSNNTNWIFTAPPGGGLMMMGIGT